MEALVTLGDELVSISTERLPLMICWQLRPKITYFETISCNKQKYYCSGFHQELKGLLIQRIDNLVKKHFCYFKGKFKIQNFSRGTPIQL